GHGQCPLWWQASVDQCYAKGGIVVQQGSVTQPRQEVVTIGGSEHIRKGILRLEAPSTVCDGQEMQIVVAQYRYRIVPQCPDKPQHLQRLRATVDEIAGKPEPVACAIKMQTVEQGEQGGKTALHIANSIHDHACLSDQYAGVHSAGGTRPGPAAHHGY